MVSSVFLLFGRPPRIDSVFVSDENRTIGNCVTCGKPKPLVSHGQCAACLMRERRAEEVFVDLHGTHPRLRKERQKLRRGYNKILDGCEDLNFSDGEMRHIRELCLPHLQKIWDTLIHESGDADDSEGETGFNLWGEEPRKPS